MPRVPGFSDLPVPILDIQTVPQRIQSPTSDWEAFKRKKPVVGQPTQTPPKAHTKTSPRVMGIIPASLEKPVLEKLAQPENSDKGAPLGPPPPKPYLNPKDTLAKRKLPKKHVPLKLLPYQKEANQVKPICTDSQPPAQKAQEWNTEYQNHKTSAPILGTEKIEANSLKQDAMDLGLNKALDEKRLKEFLRVPAYSFDPFNRVNRFLDNNPFYTPTNIENAIRQYPGPLLNYAHEEKKYRFLGWLSTIPDTKHSTVFKAFLENFLEPEGSTADPLEQFLSIELGSDYKAFGET